MRIGNLTRAAAIASALILPTSMIACDDDGDEDPIADAAVDSDLPEEDADITPEDAASEDDAATPEDAASEDDAATGDAASEGDAAAGDAAAGDAAAGDAA